MSLAAAPSRTIVALLLSLAALEARARAQIFDYQIEGGSSDLSFGSSVARIGDLDSDGCEDFIVGAPDSSNGDGAVSIYSGKAGTLIANILGTTKSQLGLAVDGRIDADADGYPDVLIGAPGESTRVFDGGRVLIYSPHLNQTLVDVYGTHSFGALGYSVRALLDDLDGDGIDDFIVGEAGVDSASVLSGRTGATIYSLSGQGGSGFGVSVSLATNLDGDKFSDFVVGSPTYQNSSGTKTGRITAFAGKDGSKLYSVNGAADSQFGTALASPGDLDGDGRSEVVVGAPFHLDSSGVKTGCATVLSGGSGSVLFKVFGNLAGDEFGHAVRAVGGDLDGDGTNDFVVGAPQLSGSGIGFAAVISGMNGATLLTLTQHSGNRYGQNSYGFAVAGGDFDGDGRTDVLVGGPAHDAQTGNVETWTTAVARWSNYGAGWPGKNGVPYLTARENPVVGQPLDVDLGNSSGITAPGLLLIGTSEESVPSGKGGTFLVDPLVIVPLSIASNGLTLSGNVPGDPSLLGLDVYLQALELDAGASQGLSFTEGLDLFLGFQ